MFYVGKNLKMGRYEVSYDEKAGSINMYLSGFFSEEDANNYVNDFIALSKRYQTTDTYLILDSALLFIYPHDMIGALSDIFKMYKAFEYKLVRLKIFKAQKEMMNKFIEMCDRVGLKHDIFYID